MPHPARPHIICHMGTSIDGRLHPSRFTAPAAGISREALRGHYERIHDSFDADGWIIGRVTMNEMAKGIERALANAAKLPREAHLGKRDGRKLAIGIDPSGRVHFGKDNVGGDHAVAVLGEQVADAHLAELREDGASYVFAGRDGHDLALAMERIGALFGVKTLLLEGGGGINGAFLKRRAVAPAHALRDARGRHGLAAAHRRACTRLMLRLSGRPRADTNSPPPPRPTRRGPTH